MTAQELRELDAWIAEHVMGRKLKHIASARKDDWYWCPNNEKVMCGDRLNLPKRSFTPTEDPADAMAVLEKIAAIPYGVIIEQVHGHPIEKRTGNFRLTTHFLQGDNSRLETEAETLPMVICLFAKKLFGKENV